MHVGGSCGSEEGLGVFFALVLPFLSRAGSVIYYSHVSG